MLTASLIDGATGAAVASAATQGAALAPGGWARLRLRLTVPGPVRLWSLADPALYTVSTVLTVAAAVVDAENTTIGVRRFQFDSVRGLLLNDQPVIIRGFANHQDFGGCGTALPDRVNAFKVSSLKAIGATAWRTSHNPVNPELLREFDTQGMLALVELRHFIATEPYVRDAVEMVLRDRNHPSVFAWSLCNVRLRRTALVPRLSARDHPRHPTQRRNHRKAGAASGAASRRWPPRRPRAPSSRARSSRRTRRGPSPPPCAVTASRPLRTRGCAASSLLSTLWVLITAPFSRRRGRSCARFSRQWAPRRARAKRTAARSLTTSRLATSARTSTKTARRQTARPSRRGASIWAASIGPGLTTVRCAAGARARAARKRAPPAAPAASPHPTAYCAPRDPEPKAASPTRRRGPRSLRISA